jgi:hypothetical protein
VAPSKVALRDTRHLLGLASLFLAGLLVFLVARSLFVPPGFGQYGHFRSGALTDNRARSLAYAGHAACEACHDAEAGQHAAGRHKGVACESCHGPLAAHAEHPESVPGRKPDGRGVCLGCHTANTAKPKAFPQIQPQEHFAGELCVTCHPAHRPEGG